MLCGPIIIVEGDWVCQRMRKIQQAHVFVFLRDKLRPSFKVDFDETLHSGW